MTNAKPTVAGRRFYLTAVVTSLLVGALQMFHIRGGVVTSYGADVFGTAWLYALFRQGRNILLRGKILPAWLAAAVVFLGCAGSEFGQKLHWVPGTYDPFDLLAYALTMLICLGIEWLICPLA